MQLQHDKKETSWEKHGYVSVRSERGELARSEDYQHNKQYAKREAMTQDLLKKVKAALAAGEKLFLPRPRIKTGDLVSISRCYLARRARGARRVTKIPETQLCGVYLRTV